MNEKKIVVGFWIRLFSDSLDAIFLGALGFVLSLPLGSMFYKMGENGLWLGLVITFLYTGILQSGIGQGQSLVKRLLKIQVLRLDGSFLNLPQSFLRYSVILF
ncbi:MAG: RDD family protein [Chlamydiae bacterium]|nr:RDD family protein [Chlamydiota bacterium]MBI3276628.1 RDD family protein [Chlamydiota bacterium]